MSLLFLPVDSRPCTYAFAAQLAASCGVRVARPPRRIMDFYLRPSRHGELEKWLLEEGRKCEEAVVSVDQLAYGGLIASRRMDLSEEEALARLSVLRKVKETSPGMKIRLFNTILRTSITMKSEEDRVWWEKVNEYSLLCGEEGKEERRRELEEEIPNRILEEYLRARKRNHRVNEETIRLVRDGIAEEALLLQEDSGKTGIHRMEQEELKKEIEEGGLQGKVHVLCGTDEGGIALAGKAVRGEKEPLKLGIAWITGSGKMTARYEDRPLEESLREYLDALGIRACRPRESDLVLAILGIEEGAVQKDWALESEGEGNPLTPKEKERACALLWGWIREGKKAALLDVREANGGDTEMMECLGKSGLLDHLSCYAGWNTACNSLGTILGNILCLGQMDEEGRIRFRDERYLDDWLYQSVVRGRLRRKLLEEGEDPWRISDVKKASELLNRMMHEAQEGEILPLAGREYVGRLAWPRVFEASVEMRGR